ncbi:MAG: F0F1 ATP synthase subunit B [Oscillospiraceae bacterium]|nr:F0F1 ATP synthase subunit B [Oscillospiraceae bacterium]
MVDRIFLSAAESMPEGSVLALDTEFLVRVGIQWFNIIVLSVFLVKILYKPVKNFLAERADRISSDIDSARLNNEQAEALKADYQKMLDNIGKEREEILNEASRAAVKKHDQIIFDAQEEAKYIKTKAKDEIKLERENAANEIRNQIIEVSNLIASRFVEVSVDQQTRDRYINEALADWSEQV